MAEKYVYRFEEGSKDDRARLGGKGANLAEMTRVGLPVPPGFTVTAPACNAYNKLGRQFPEGLEDDVWREVAALEERAGKQFGDRENPLLVSVRSGAAVSMPGMMDTVLNLGLNPQTREGLGARAGRRFALDCHRRFIQMFGNVVLHMEHSDFETVLHDAREKAGVHQDHELTESDLEEIIVRYLQLVERHTGRPFPEDPREQLILAIRAVFDSWENPRAKVYRRINQIPDDLGTAVNVQAMVFGNLSPQSGTGVLFTRNPNTGEKVLYGEYLTQAQGEDVVAGIRTPKEIGVLKDDIPAAYDQVEKVAQLLERHYADMQDIEFTIEDGRLYMLQTRSGKRSARASVKIAVDLVREGRISKAEALGRVTPEQVDQLLHRGVDPHAQNEVLAKGLPASPGAASGQIVFDADTAEKLGRLGEKVLLVRPETAPDDIHGIVLAQGVLTSRGGMTCHAAIVARGMGKPCIVGCEALKIDLGRKELQVGDRTFKENDTISIDGATGRVFAGQVAMVEPELGKEASEILAWADETRRLGVMANADTPEDAEKARAFGAQGVGLCRTEHMFMQQDRLPVVQEMILAGTEAERRAALDRLLPFQEGDFYGILKAMRGLPVTIRLLDPPLHEFLPDVEELAVEVALLKERGQQGSEAYRRKADLLRQARALSEFNPMLGFRGCRLGLIYPEIYEMQARAIFQATARLQREGIDVHPEVMIPLVGDPKELQISRKLVAAVHQQVQSETGASIPLKVGTMLEVPRACLLAGEIAQHADFFSFGTNDLTQTTFGYSRDDAEGKFLTRYLEEKVLEENPFAVLDQAGVGQLVTFGVARGRAVKPELKVGICGEHGGEPRSIAFCHRTGLNYVSCSPYRVPIARLAAARAALED
ncbi:MAG: pyruvate, phosphate dikinase [Thermaerobacter sp.]|nr:pyruvate, phosphate dikinase [Thermaerobacter sp.]